MDYDKLLELSTELGCRLMSSGAEIYRVEESIFRLLRAYGLEAPQVFAIPNCLIVSVTTPQGHPITRMRRIPGHGTDLELLEQCNGLCRALCARTPPLDEAQEQVAALGKNELSYRPAQILFGYGMVAAFFTPLFGGGVRDAVCACLCGLAVGICALYGKKIMGSNVFFRTLICSAVASMLALLFVRLGLGISLDTITISVLMLLVPGMSLTNAMREIMAGDVFSGLSRSAEAILTGTAIALGAALGLAIGQIL